MPPDLNMNEPEPRPQRVFNRMPRLMEPIPQAPPRQQQPRDRNGNRNQNRNQNQNQPGGQNNNGQREGEQPRRLPLLFRLLIGPQIARYMRMRRAVNDARRPNVVVPANVAPDNAVNAELGPGNGRRVSEPEASTPDSSVPGPSSQGPSSSRRQ